MCLSLFAAAAKRFFQKSQQVAISFYLSFCLFFFGLWKCSHPAMRFALNKLHSSHNNENVRGGAIKAFLAVSYGLETVNSETGSDYVM